MKLQLRRRAAQPVTVRTRCEVAFCVLTPQATGFCLKHAEEFHVGLHQLETELAGLMHEPCTP